MYPKNYFDENKPQPINGTCFVLMPFAESFNEVYRAIHEAVEDPELNYSCTRADESLRANYIITDILKSLGEAELIIADLTGQNPNVFYELGVTHMVKDLEKVIILTQDMKYVPFDLRPFRCIVYEQNQAGLHRLQTTLIDWIKKPFREIYRFSVKDGEPYHFPHKLFGTDRCAYDFEFTEIMVFGDAVKYNLRENRYVIGEPAEIIQENTNGIPLGEQIKLTNVPWLLKLEEVHGNVAHFRVIPI
jgi:hypothetical protein